MLHPDRSIIWSPNAEKWAVSVSETLPRRGMVVCPVSQGGEGQSRLQEEHYKFDGLIDSGVRQVQHLQFISCKVYCIFSFFFLNVSIQKSCLSQHFHSRVVVPGSHPVLHGPSPVHFSGVFYVLGMTANVSF